MFNLSSSLRVIKFTVACKGLLFRDQLRVYKLKISKF